MIHTLEHAFLDTIKILPFLYLSYLVLDIIEKRSSTYQLNYLFLKNLGPVFGALLGCIPQCGFSIIAASLFAQNGITAGTLVACFISTSDEALPMFLSNPSEYKNLGYLILCKVLIAIVAGYILDFIIRKDINEEDDFEIEVEGICDCSTNSFINAGYKALRTILYIFIINLTLGLIIHFVGEDVLVSTLNVNTFIQPFISTILGFIPNCAISVLLVQLYMVGGLTFGSMIAGLCSGAGMGVAILFKNNKNMKENWFIIAYIATIAISSGIIIDMIL